LGVSKASASMRISELERAAGVLLVRRTTRSVGLTEAGQQLVNDMLPAFGRISDSYTAVKDLVGTPRGLVRVTAPVALGRQHLAPCVAALEYSVARASKKLACSTPDSSDCSHGSGFSVTP
jgi:DNA-binding transcriptional LysR family regulator